MHRSKATHLDYVLGSGSLTKKLFFFDIILLRKKPLRFLGIPLQNPVYRRNLHDNTNAQVRSPIYSSMIIPGNLDPYASCALDFVSSLSFDPTFLLYCKKVAVEIVDGRWKCQYDEVPYVVEISRVVIPVRPHGAEKKPSKSPKLVTCVPCSIAILNALFFLNYFKSLPLIHV